jgi:hypothetical protein
MSGVLNPPPLKREGFQPRWVEVHGRSNGRWPLSPRDSVADVAVDPGSGQAFAVWQDFGNPPEEGDGVGRLAVYDTAALTESGPGAELPGYTGQLGSSSVAVTPGGDTVFVASPADASLTTFRRPVPPALRVAAALRITVAVVLAIVLAVRLGVTLGVAARGDSAAGAQ